MARGKYGAAAAKRRADTAEAQLDRLLPKLVDAERTTKRYRSEAEAAPVLRRQLAELRDALGVPRSEHEAEVARLEAEAHERATMLIENLTVVFDELAQLIPKRWGAGDDFSINARFIRALQRLPREPVEHLLTKLGVEREVRRYFMNEEHLPERIARVDQRELVAAQILSRQAGAPDGKILGTLIEPPEHPLHRGSETAEPSVHQD